MCPHSFHVDLLLHDLLSTPALPKYAHSIHSLHFNHYNEYLFEKLVRKQLVVIISLSKQASLYTQYCMCCCVGGGDEVKLDDSDNEEEEVPPVAAAVPEKEAAEPVVGAVSPKPEPTPQISVSQSSTASSKLSGTTKSSRDEVQNQVIPPACFIQS